MHSVVSVAQFSQVASGHFGSGGGCTSTHGLVALPLAPPLGEPPLVLPPLINAPPAAELPATALPLAPPCVPLLPLALCMPPLLEPAKLPAPEVVRAPPLPPLAPGASLDEQPPATGNAAENRTAKAPTTERREREPEMCAIFCVAGRS